MSIFEKLKLSLFYDGLTKDEYNSVAPYIMKENNKRLKIYNIVAFVFVLALFVLSLFWDRLSSKTFFYLGSSIINLVLVILLCSKVQYNRIVSKIINVFFISLILFFTIYIGTIKGEGLPAVTFFAVLAIIPYITYEKVLFGILHRFIFLLLFFVLSILTKRVEFVQTDILNGISVFVISTIAGIHVQKMQVNSWVTTNNMDKTITKMSGMFESIRVIDLRSNLLLSYFSDGQSEETISDTNLGASIQVDKYIEDFVNENNKTHMRQFCDLSTLEDRLYNKDILICDYSTKDITWRRATFVAIEKDEKGFATKVVFSIQRIADSFYLNMLEFDINKIK